jgi:uncharacterized protein YecE (DUF72 family)
VRIRLGCTGWAYEDWKGPFYPSQCNPSEYLERYAQVFDFTEVDSSFYGPPTAETTTRWAAATPDGFLFALKVPGEITHEKRLRGIDADLQAFLDGIRPLQRADKLGPLVLQMPPSFAWPQERAALEGFLGSWPKDLRLAVELRDPTWWNDATFDLLRSRGAGLVWSINQYGDAPPVRTADFVYVRFVGDRQITRFDRVQRDLRPIIEQWKPRVTKEDAREAFLVVNNHFMGFAPASARVAADVFGLAAPDLSKASRRRHQAGLGQF